ncbi:MAG: SDR family NAD(P)-dependent oxidoreductase [Chitinophagaceae bacterium]
MNNNCYTLITGASEGLGKALAIECAGRNMNLILVALPGPELYSLASLIKGSYRVQVICIGKDLCRDESCIELYGEISTMNLPVNVLINNAGIGSTVLFEEGSPGFYEKQIRLNVLATTLLTRLFLKTLQRNNHSYILNVGSMASFFYLPKKQVYGATKSYIYFFSKSLRKELRKSNVHVSVLCPGGMNTNLSLTLMNKTGNCLSRLSVMDPEDVVPIAIDGLLRGKEVIIPGKLNNFFMLLDKVLPEVIKKIITHHGMKKLNHSNSLTRYTLPAMVPVPVVTSSR